MLLLKRWRILMQHQIYFIWMILMRLNGTRKLLGQGMKYRSDIIEPTTSYLGAQLKKKALSNGKNYWSLPSDIFVNGYIINMDEAVNKKGRNITTKVRTPMTSDFVAELDSSPELSKEELKFYQELIADWDSKTGH